MDSSFETFPPEILEIISRQGQDPTLYRSMALASSGMERAISGSLPEICRTPISISELLNYVSSELAGPNFTIFLLPANLFAEKIYIEYRSGQPIRFRRNSDNMRIEPNEFLRLLPSLYQEYPVIDVRSLYQILSRRTSCVLRDRHYALRRTWEVVVNRIETEGRTYREAIQNRGITDEELSNLAGRMMGHIWEFPPVSGVRPITVQAYVRRLRQLDNQGTSANDAMYTIARELIPMMQAQVNQIVRQ